MFCGNNILNAIGFIMIRRFLLVAIAFGLFALPGHAAPKKTEPSSGMSKQDELQIMKRACQMSGDDYTSAEIINQVSYLVKINRTQTTLPKGQGTGTFPDEMMDRFSSLVEESNAITNKQIAFSLMRKAAAKNCRF